MKIYKAYKFRIYPNYEQYGIIMQNIGSSRFIYNYFLNLKDKYYKETKTNLSLKTMKHMLVEMKNNKDYEFLKDVDSMALTNSLECLDKAYTNFFEGKANHPVFKRKGVHDSYITDCIRSTYKNRNYSNIELDLIGRTMKLPKLGIVKIRGYRNMQEFNGQIISACISSDAGKLYVSITVSEEIVVNENIEYTEWKAVGLDVGVKSLVVTSMGVEYEKIKLDRLENHIKKLQKDLSYKVKGSNNYKKLKNKIARLYQKMRNTRKYYIHEITDKITKENDVIITENLKVKEMITRKTSTKSLRRGLTNASLFELERQLEYKTKWRGKKLIKINKYYPSSQICSSCGYKNTKIKDLSVRVWTCPECLHEHDRDINASLNILFQGLLQLNGLKVRTI